MKKMTLTELDGIKFYIDTSYEHSIDGLGYKAYYEYPFTPYAALRNESFQKYDESIKVGANESRALEFIRKELRIKLLQTIYAGHELNEQLFIMIGLGKTNSATIFNANTLFWQMASDMSYSEGDKLPGKDFAAFFEKNFHLERETAWRFAWALVRTAYAEYWPSIHRLLGLAEEMRAAKGKNRDKAKADFLST